MGVWRWRVPPCRVSHAVQEVMQGLTVLCLSLIDSPVDSTGVLCLRGGCLAGLLALAEDLSDVGVVSHCLVCVDVISLQGQWAAGSRQRDTSPGVLNTWPPAAWHLASMRTLPWLISMTDPPSSATMMPVAIA